MTIKLAEIELTMMSDALEIALDLRWQNSWISGTARALIEKLDKMTLEIEGSDAAELTTIKKKEGRGD